MISMSNRIASGIAAGFASAVLVAMATPVSAGTLAKQGDGRVTTTADNIATPSDTTVAPAATRQPRYCFVETFTGSRIPHKICKTKAEWAEEGTDITAK